MVEAIMLVASEENDEIGSAVFVLLVIGVLIFLVFVLNDMSTNSSETRHHETGAGYTPRSRNDSSFGPGDDGGDSGGDGGGGSGGAGGGGG